MLKVVSNAQMRNMDQKAINEYSIPGIVLMENAGRNSAEIIIEVLYDYDINAAVVFAGKGNNGGDGFVIARYLYKEGFDVSVYLAARKNEIKGDALINLNICLKSSIPIIEINDLSQIDMPANEFVVIDALLGTGVKGAVKGFYAEIIDWINRQDVLVCSIDIPSGLSGDDALVAGPAVEADLTITMGLPKTSMFFYPARALVGDLEVAEIGFPIQIERDHSVKLQAVFEEDIILEYPKADLNKHSAGRVFILGSSPGMTGATVLAAQGASLAGAGLVIAGVATSLNSILENKLTEQMSVPLPENEAGILCLKALEDIKEKIDWSDVFVLGPGIGRSNETTKLLEKIFKYLLGLDKKIIIDADALFFLSENLKILEKLNENSILTPHHGEFKRLFPDGENELISQPWIAMENFNSKYKCVLDLKGAPSLVGQRDNGVYINTTGNPGLAKGGSGDLLAGLIAGLISSGLETTSAAVYANFIHGRAADNLSDKLGMRSFSMEDLMLEIKLVFNQLFDNEVN